MTIQFRLPSLKGFLSSPPPAERGAYHTTMNSVFKSVEKVCDRSGLIPGILCANPKAEWMRRYNGMNAVILSFEAVAATLTVFLAYAPAVPLAIPAIGFSACILFGVEMWRFNFLKYQGDFHQNFFRY
jgi:hypothetical protein